jgi:phage repressor protein C with HTH and peptisase S24 domain
MISPEWLLTGKGSMLKSDEQPLPEAKKTSSRHKGIPLIPMEAIAGFPAIDNDGVSFDDCQHYSIPEFEAKGANFLIRVSGDSMTPLYCNGDIIACRKISEIHFFQWGGVYVLDTSQGVLVKYVEECEKNDDCILCVSENKRYKPFPLPKDDIRSLSTIVGLVRLV